MRIYQVCICVCIPKVVSPLIFAVLVDREGGMLSGLNFLDVVPIHIHVMQPWKAVEKKSCLFLSAISLVSIKYKYNHFPNQIKWVIYLQG